MCIRMSESLFGRSAAAPPISSPPTSPPDEGEDEEHIRLIHVAMKISKQNGPKSLFLRFGILLLPSPRDFESVYFCMCVSWGVLRSQC